MPERDRQKLAAAPITWGVCELPDWGVVLPAAQVLDEIAAAGFSGTELGPDGYLGRDAREIEGALSSRGLSLVGAFCPLPLTDPDGGRSALPGAIDLAQLLAVVGCETLVAADAGSDQRRHLAGRVTPGEAHTEWGVAAETLASLAQRTAELGVNVVFHPHAGTHVETESELDGLMAAAPENIGLCLDTGHIAYGGGDPVAVARRYGARIRHVHLKDVSAHVLQSVRRDAMGYEHAIGEGAFTPLGEGSVDFPAVVASLRERGYAGWWVLEQDVRLLGPGAESLPLENARASLSYIKALLR